MAICMFLIFAIVALIFFSGLMTYAKEAAQVSCHQREEGGERWMPSYAVERHCHSSAIK